MKSKLVKAPKHKYDSDCAYDVMRGKVEIGTIWHNSGEMEAYCIATEDQTTLKAKYPNNTPAARKALMKWIDDQHDMWKKNYKNEFTQKLLSV